MTTVQHGIPTRAQQAKWAKETMALVEEPMSRYGMVLAVVYDPEKKTDQLRFRAMNFTDEAFAQTFGCLIDFYANILEQRAEAGDEGARDRVERCKAAKKALGLEANEAPSTETSQ